MNNKILLSILLLFLSTAAIYAQNGSITGKITDENGIPLEFATVNIKNTSKGTVTDNNGRFVLDKIPEGNHVLVFQIVGYIKREVDVDVRKDETVNLPQVILRQDVQQLRDVEIVGSKEINPFADKETDYVARMPLTNLENPQVYSVVNKELLEEQVITDINETVRNSPGVVPVDYPSGGFGTTFRGFRIGVSARNGMETVTGRSSVDIGNVERIEVLKGPSGTLFGSSVSSFGGVINLVTKKPLASRKAEVSYTTGSFSLHRITADINTPLNEEKTVLFRLNAGVHREKSFMNYGFNNTFLIAPSLLYEASDKLTFTLDAELFSANNTRTRYSRYDANSGITSPEDIKLDYETALYHDDADAETSSTKIFAQAKYQLARNWTATTLFSFVGEEVDHSYQYYPTWLSPTLAARSVAVYGPIYNNYTNIQENINGEFATGSIYHKVLIGANYRYFTPYGGSGSTGFIDTVDITTDFQPLRKNVIDPYVTQSLWSRANEHTISSYVSDVIQFTDRISAMLSLRVDHYKRDKTGTTEGYEQTALAPKFGLVYQVVKDRVSVFGNYMSGFQNQAPRTQPDGSQLILDPVFAIQSEGGIKTEAFDKKLSTTISYYHIAIDNAIRTGADGFAVQNGKQVSKGFDIEVITNPVGGLNLVAGYAYNDNRIVKATDESIEGNKAVNSPENVINFWASYTFQNSLKGLGVGFGGNYVGKSYMFDDNVFTIPEYTLVNASLFYNQPKWRLGFKLNNLTNEKYWTIWGVPQAPTNFAANLTLRF